MTLEQLQKILFLDIETVSRHHHYEEMSAPWQALWEDKTRYLRKEESPADFYEQRAGIWAEFGQVVCISCGYFSYQEGGLQFRVKSFAGDDESQLLGDFAATLERMSQFALAAHNGKEFDFPYLSRRMLIRGIPLPGQLNNAGRKPWEIPHFDTLELWKFGDYKHYTSLKLLAALFDIPTPKDDIDGSQVGAVYWEEQDIDRIRIYCEKDTLTLARVFVRIAGVEGADDFDIIGMG